VARDAGTTRADATATEAASLDCTVIDRLRDMERRGASGLLARLVATYMTTAARLIAQADAAALREDTQQMRHAVHTLKSSSANLGASALAQGCAELEEMLGSGRVLAACQRWPAVRIEYERVVPALEALARAATLSSRAPADVATS
jgi:HPt (histidine-containing phosphotransfer) domain-containing protein